MKRNTLIVFVAILILMVACGGPNKLTKSQKKDYGEEQFSVCGEEALEYEEQFFVGIGEGKSINSQMSKKMAKTEARNALAETMNTFVKEGITNEINQGTKPSDYSSDYQTKVEQLVSQRLQGLSTFCSKTFLNDQGEYTSFSGLKLDINRDLLMAQVKEELGL